MTAAPNANRPIIEDNSTMSQQFRTWTRVITEQITIIGTGTPEASVVAPVSSQYMDDAGTAGNILYIKRDPDVAGDKSKGWILV